LPAELERREMRLQKIREAKRALEERPRQKAAAEGGDAKQAKPKDKYQYNFTDPAERAKRIATGSPGIPEMLSRMDSSLMRLRQRATPLTSGTTTVGTK
jgi:hypothetical protein